jgi:hypothetical protein
MLVILFLWANFELREDKKRPTSNWVYSDRQGILAHSLQGNNIQHGIEDLESTKYQVNLDLNV